MKFQPGQRVKLLPFEDEPEQTGVVLEADHHHEMYVVWLDTTGLERGDDGLREVDDSQMEAL